jgi:hypothetical protein
MDPYDDFGVALARCMARTVEEPQVRIDRGADFCGLSPLGGRDCGVVISVMKSPQFLRVAPTAASAGHFADAARAPRIPCPTPLRQAHGRPFKEGVVVWWFRM